MAKVITLSRNFLPWERISFHWSLLRKKAINSLSKDHFFLSLLIAFFVVILAALLLKLAYEAASGVSGVGVIDESRALFMMTKG